MSVCPGSLQDVIRDLPFELFAPCLEDGLAVMPVVDFCTSVSLAGQAPLEADADAGSHTCSQAGGCARVSGLNRHYIVSEYGRVWEVEVGNEQ